MDLIERILRRLPVIIFSVAALLCAFPFLRAIFVRECIDGVKKTAIKMYPLAVVIAGFFIMYAGIGTGAWTAAFTTPFWFLVAMFTYPGNNGNRKK